MWFDSSLAGLSIWITYCLQVVFAYLTTLGICALIQNPRARVRMWGCFLFLTIATWLLLWVPTRAGGPIHFAFGAAPLPRASNLHLALPVKNVLASFLAKFAPVAWIAYLTLLLASLLHLALKSIKLRVLVSRVQLPSPRLQLLFQSVSTELGITRSKLGLVSKLRSPATCYWLRSYVLLPAEMVPQLDSDQLADVLRHELIHVRQQDYLWDRLAALGCRLVLFHPLVWLAYRRLRWERELACDLKVVEQRAEARLPYAECLTRLARWFMEKKRVPEGIGFFSSESLLTVRVRALLTEPSSYTSSQKAVRVTLVAIMTAAALFFVPSFGLSLYSPVLLSALLHSRDVHIDSVSKKTQKSKVQHLLRDKRATAEFLGKIRQSQPSQPVDLFLDSNSTSLPVLQASSTEAPSPADAGPTSYDNQVDGVRLHSSDPAWDEAPMPLASPPKWRRIIVGAITGGLAVATGRIDVDDVDGPRKRDR